MYSLQIVYVRTHSPPPPPPPPPQTHTHTLQDNEYIQAIKSVASVLAPYDSDQLIPTFGFGGRLPPDGHVSHCFPLNFNYEKPEVYGVQVSGVCMCAGRICGR